VAHGGLAFGNSATIEFMPGGPEGLRITAGGETSSPTIEAVVMLGKLGKLEPVTSSVTVAGFLISTATPTRATPVALRCSDSRKAMAVARSPLAGSGR
jgi:hypothetical protein